MRAIIEQTNPATYLIDNNHNIFQKHVDQLHIVIINFELNNESAFEDDITLISNNKFPTEQNNLAHIPSEDSKIESENSNEQLPAITTPTPEIMPITTPVNNHNEMNTNGNNLNSAPMLDNLRESENPQLTLRTIHCEGGGRCYVFTEQLISS